MVNEKLVQWMKASLKQGHNHEHLQQILVEHGHNKEEVQEALQHIQKEQQTLKQPLQKTKLILIGVIVLIAALIVFFIVNLQHGEVKELTENSEITQPESTAQGEVTLNIKHANETQKQDCKDLHERLRTCERFTCEEEYPYTKELLKKETSQLPNNKCMYIEELPDNTKLVCELTREYQEILANYFNNSYQQVFETYIINDKEVEQPILELMSLGKCIVQQR